ncbi:MAG: SpoVR family protein [Deltaproteobacteria bacterium CG11_big_fil_rev_8_21_14_0_20_45_16]|nr:MAG: SpoVR family protein [Deltaproteobacteria bacterium CG11_big_fil_rev_8_21_14_0_20_45_16]
MNDLPIELMRHKEDIEKIAKSYGLDFYTTIFEMVDYDVMNQLAAYGGFPTRYPHWSFGMDYERLSKSYSYGLSKIYEMVINNDPVIAYLMKGNTLMDQKLVMAHVYGHADFFKNNYYFSTTNRKAIDMMANHGVKIRRFVERIGPERVESFIDLCQSIDNLIDPQGIFKKAGSMTESVEDSEMEPSRTPVGKLKSKDYMDKYINPPEYLEQQRQKNITEQEKKGRIPAQPDRDILAFLIHYAPLENWERETLDIIREEAYYFAPQGQTKIMNEGWASYWHTTIMTKHKLEDSEVIDYANSHAGTVAMSGGRINPYKIGLELFRDIEDRWNRGRFGMEYENCGNIAEKKAWDKKLGLGKKKIFEVRKIYNDVTFIDEFLTPDFCAEHKLFTFQLNPKSNDYEIASREFQKIKRQFLFQLTYRGVPPIAVVDGNYQNRGELYLWHPYEGEEVKLDTAKETLVRLAKIWKRPVHLQTLIQDQYRLLSYDGKEYTEKNLNKEEAFKA